MDQSTSTIPAMLEVSTKSYISIEMDQVFLFLFSIAIDHGYRLGLSLDQSTMLCAGPYITINGPSLSLSLIAMDLVDTSSIAIERERERGRERE